MLGMPIVEGEDDDENEDDRAAKGFSFRELKGPGAKVTTGQQKRSACCG
jgi:hypothetical protein